MIEPNNDYVFVVEDFSENVTKSGIIFAEDKSKPSKGTVFAVGKGRYLQSGAFVDTTVKVKDKVLVLFQKKDTVSVDVEGVECLMIMEEDILWKSHQFSYIVLVKKRRISVTTETDKRDVLMELDDVINQLVDIKNQIAGV